MSRWVACSALAALSGMLLAASPLPATPQPRPNLIVVVVDDLGWQDIQLPLADSATPSNARYRTPALLALAARGTTFTNAYAAAPVCTPSRVAFITGRMPATTHVTNWTQHRNEETSESFPGLWPPEWARNGVSPDRATPNAHHGPLLPALLQQVGYRTIHIGKAHWGAVDTPGADPHALGFDVNIGGSGAGQSGSYLPAKRYSSGPGAGRFRDVPGLDQYADSGVFLTEALTREATAAMANAVAQRRPFFLHFAHFAVHTPIERDRRFAQRYLDAGLGAREANYAALIEGVDNSLGDVIAEAERLGVLENTLIVFTSDNGGLSAHSRDGTVHTHNAPLRSGKGSAYDGGLRVPLVIAWPGHGRRGARRHEPVITDDLFATLLEAARVPDAHRYSTGTRAHSLLPLLGADTGRQHAVSRRFTNRPLLWHYPHYWGVAGPGIEPFSALRVGRWKLVHFYGGSRTELYDLDADLGEQQDLAARQPALTRRLLTQLGTSLRAAGAQRPLDATTRREVPWPGATRD